VVATGLLRQQFCRRPPGSAHWRPRAIAQRWPRSVRSIACRDGPDERPAATIGTSMMPSRRSSRAFADAKVGHRVAIGRERQDRHFEDSLDVLCGVVSDARIGNRVRGGGLVLDAEEPDSISLTRTPGCRARTESTSMRKNGPVAADGGSSPVVRSTRWRVSMCRGFRGRASGGRRLPRRTSGCRGRRSRGLRGR